jgi:hypothetical protein
MCVIFFNRPFGIDPFKYGNFTYAFIISISASSTLRNETQVTLHAFLHMRLICVLT